MKFARMIFALLLLPTLIGQALVQTIGPTKILLVETGEGFHGDEVKARNGEIWLGLYVTKRGSFLAESKLRVRRVIDVVVDEDPRKPTGKSVSVDRRQRPVFLVKNAEMLKPGAVNTIYRGSDTAKHALMVGTRIKLNLNGQDYALRVTSKKKRSTVCPECLPMDARLILNLAASEQVVFDLGKRPKSELVQEPASSEEKQEFTYSEETEDTMAWYLLWAGDVDGDGKLDMYLEISGENFQNHVLLLSSQARTRQLVREVARFTMVGC